MWERQEWVKAWMRNSEAKHSVSEEEFRDIKLEGKVRSCGVFLDRVRHLDFKKKAVGSH